MPTSTDHDHSHVSRTNQISRRDPTQTITLRKRYAQEARGRWDNVIRQIREAVIENDVFGMRANVETPGPSSYSFPTDSEKVSQMDNFIKQLINDEVLEPVNVDAPGTGPSEHWQYPYVRRASRKGIKDAEKFMREAGYDPDSEDIQKAFNRPIHAQTLNKMWTRQFEALKKIGDDTAQGIREELTKGFAKGHNPRKIARNMTEEVDGIGRHRSTVMARTEVIRTHSESALDRYERAGVDKVTGRAEWLSAGDSRVCPICESLNGVQFAIKEARGMIPTHPQCRCTWTLVQRQSDVNPERFVSGR
jgi:SPP1 gp7 family putative phage head morphogenesis protein